MESPGTSYLYTIALLGMTFTGERTSRYVRVNVTIIQLISLTLLIVATGLFHERSGPAFLTALTAFLTFALVAWLRALSIILVAEAH